MILAIEPDFVIAWHIRPGTEAGCTLDGTGELHVGGEAPQILRPGSPRFTA